MITAEKMTVEHFARALDRDTGTIREEVGPFVCRDDAEDAPAELKVRFTRGTTFRIRTIATQVTESGAS